MDSENIHENQKRVPFAQTFISKGVVFICLLLAYATFLVLVVLQERDVPLKQLEEYQSIQKAEHALVQADLAAYQVVTALFSKVKNNDLRAIVKYFTVLRENYKVLEAIYPEKADSFRQLVEVFPSVISQPNRENFAALHKQLTRSKTEIDQLLGENREKREKLLLQYRKHSNDVITTTMTLSIIGLFLLGGITGVFFFRLTRDINRLQNRVSEIIKGYRGTALPVSRKDELGQLTSGVNYMAQALKEREKELEIERRRFSYHEKMIAVESLAGGIAHEIGNPITCIAGLAHELQEEISEDTNENIKLNVQSILSYSEGLAKITRDLSIISTPSDDQRQLLDFNQLITSICGLLQYDQRWALVEIKYHLDQQLPALSGYSDQLSLLLSNILENSLYALRNQDSPVPTITITTELGPDGNFVCRIKDNGKGMDEATSKRVFEPFYSTKPVGEGTGLGLSLCWSIVNSHHGIIQLDSTLEEGTEVSIQIPVNQSEQVDVSYG